MKIVLFSGVGFADNIKNYESFLNKVGKGTGCDTEFFKWEHYYSAPEIYLPYKSFREWVVEVLLDFQQVVKHSEEMEVPEADLYIGHSAGSILALAQKEKPCIIFGSPAGIMECIQGQSSRDMVDRLLNSNRKAFNIVNKYDVLAYPIEHINIENWFYSDSWFKFGTYFPLSAHQSYWTNSKVINKVVEKVKEYQKCSE